MVWEIDEQVHVPARYGRTYVRPVPPVYPRPTDGAGPRACRPWGTEGIIVRGAGRKAEGGRCAVTRRRAERCGVRAT
jgi:hypothetical protein